MGGGCGLCCVGCCGGVWCCVCGVCEDVVVGLYCVGRWGDEVL